MESERNQAETQTPESESAPGSTSLCQRVKSGENAGFVANMWNHFSEFIHASMDEHKACFKETFQKVIDRCDDWNCNDKFESFKSIFTFQKKD
ncbi:hypothetical protein CRYUN_Cryun15aG0135000 [Craigia yunnanensis]